MGNYTKEMFTRRINNDHVNVAFEIGSRDGLDAIDIKQFYACDVHVFEPNPESIIACKKNLANHDLFFNEVAAWNKTENIPFYSSNVDMGTSSCFPTSGDYDHIQELPSERIDVPAIRLDQYCITNNISEVELIAMDVQGAALQVLEGLGTIIDTVKYVITELEVRPIYSNQSLFSEVESFLKTNGFELVESEMVNDFFGDFIFVRK